MRNLLSILLISISFFAHAQTSKKITLCTDDKITLHNFSFWLDVKVKSADTSFFYALHSNKKDVIDNFKNIIPRDIIDLLITNKTFTYPKEYLCILLMLFMRYLNLYYGPEFYKCI